MYIYISVKLSQRWLLLCTHTFHMISSQWNQSNIVSCFYFCIIFLFLLLYKEIKVVIGSLGSSVRREHRTMDIKETASNQSRPDPAFIQDVHRRVKTERKSWRICKLKAEITNQCSLQLNSQRKQHTTQVSELLFKL